MRYHRPHLLLQVIRQEILLDESPPSLRRLLPTPWLSLGQRDAGSPSLVEEEELEQRIREFSCASPNDEGRRKGVEEDKKKTKRRKKSGRGGGGGVRPVVLKPEGTGRCSPRAPILVVTTGMPASRFSSSCSRSCRSPLARGSRFFVLKEGWEESEEGGWGEMGE
eukprot:766451-Hanusia_phi.AAC.1